MNISERKKIHISVQKGILKGKKIPLPPSLKGHRNFTSSLIKEALFQLTENFFEIRFDGQKRSVAFFDLCAGSGQIGIEAYSRGFRPVHIVEKDRKRFEFILEHLKDYQKNRSRLVFHQKDFRRLADDMALFPQVVAFIDLPYSFWKGDGTCFHIDDFLIKFFDSISCLNQKDFRVFNKRYLLIIQSPVPYQLSEYVIKKYPRSMGILQQDIKHYRKHYLNLLKINLTC